MMTRFYDLIFSVFALFSIPKFFIRLNQAEDGKRLIRERFGIFSESIKRACSGQNVVWLHAVSVGEVMALREWVRQFLEAYPEWMLVFSTSTPTGQSVAQTLASDRVIVFYAPFDLSSAVRKTIQAIQPKLIVLAETEIWPNLISEADARGIPIGIVNGRISPRSFRRYRLIRKWLASILNRLSFCLVQSEHDRNFFTQLGMAEEKIVETGNMKFDQASNSSCLPDVEDVFKNRIKPDRLILIGGSTSWNEEAILLRVFGRLKKAFPHLQLILAPRHPERIGKVVQEIKKSKFQYQLYSQNLSTPSDVVVIDRMGVLASLYSVADAVFVGGSLVRRGGQNPIEAARFKKPVLHGPNVFNFEGIYHQLDVGHAAFCVQSEEELLRELSLLLKSPELRREAGERAWFIVQSMKGATARTLDYLSRWVRREHSVPVFAGKI
jgi:3-deoxy-D-manno-octulosonic-acid transferase